MSKTILITGASSGIGKSTAKLFQEKGWNVIATMRTPEKEEELNTLENVLVTRLDVLDLESIDSALAAGIAKFGQIDVVLNNAGYGLMGTFESAKRESIIRQFGVNVQGLFDVTQKTLPHFRANKSG
ncbi:MAG: SDR family NAD(P)-dependent oxidoreductase, partial [Bacteroidota bacterium]